MQWDKWNVRISSVKRRRRKLTPSLRQEQSKLLRRMHPTWKRMTIHFSRSAAKDRDCAPKNVGRADTCMSHGAKHTVHLRRWKSLTETSQTPSTREVDVADKEVEEPGEAGEGEAADGEGHHATNISTGQNLNTMVGEQPSAKAGKPADFIKPFSNKNSQMCKNIKPLTPNWGHM